MSPSNTWLHKIINQTEVKRRRQGYSLKVTIEVKQRAIPLAFTCKSIRRSTESNAAIQAFSPDKNGIKTGLAIMISGMIHKEYTCSCCIQCGINERTAIVGHSLPCLTLDDLVRILTSHGICARIGDVPTQNDVASKCLIAGVSIDSRRIEKGELFICKGAAFKSSYLISAIEQGAAAYLCEEALADELAQIAPETPCIIVDDIRRSMAYVSAQAYNHPDKRLQVFGITGTKGKSTTSYMLKSIFEASGRVPSILGSINTEDGIESFESHHTTPEAPDLWRHLSNTEQVGRDTVVMEVSSQALKYDRTLGLSFTVGCFLNIERDHISPVEHENFDDYFSSKLKLFAQSDTVVINLNSHYEQEIIHAAQQNKRVVTFGVDRPEADYCALHLCAHDGKVEFDLIENAGRNSCTTPAPPSSIHINLGIAGLFNVENALAAIAMARIAGISFEHIAAALKHVHVPGRMELVVTPDKHIVAIVDYAHNNLSFKTLFESVQAEYPDRKIISVFGAAGNKSLGRRRDLPQIAAAYSDLIIFTEVDPGYEQVEDICTQLAQNTPKDMPYEIICDRESAIKRAVEAADVPSVVLVLGKGDETFQRRGDDYVTVKSDLEITRELLLGQENV